MDPSPSSRWREAGVETMWARRCDESAEDLLGAILLNALLNACGFNFRSLLRTFFYPDVLGRSVPFSAFYDCQSTTPKPFFRID